MKLVNQTYAADTTIERQVGRYHLNFKTDAFGRPVLLFLCKHSHNGKIMGERFTRHLVTMWRARSLKTTEITKGNLNFPAIPSDNDSF